MYQPKLRLLLTLLVLEIIFVSALSAENILERSNVPPRSKMKIAWKADKHINCWRAFVKGGYIGTVYPNGSAVFGDDRVLAYGCHQYGSIYLAAKGLVNYINSGGSVK